MGFQKESPRLYEAFLETNNRLDQLLETTAVHEEDDHQTAVAEELTLESTSTEGSGPALAKASHTHDMSAVASEVYGNRAIALMKIMGW